MEKRICRKLVVLLLTLCISVLVGFCMLNGNFRITSASADTVASSIEESLTFNLFNNGSEYKVSARNKQIIDVSIPAMLNGLPVTEIADNGFTNCTSLKNVQLPYTIKRIGNNAFANCKNLEVINGMPRVESIGNNAFAMCTKLDNLILPNTINNLGSTILRNNPNTVYSRLEEAQMASLNASWNSNSTAVYIYGDDLVLNEVRDENDLIKGYSVTTQQNIYAPEVDFVIGDTYKGLPLLEIEQSAFFFSEFNSFTLRHGEIILNDEDSSELAVAPQISEDCEHTVNIASSAFTLMTANYIDLLVDITFNDDDVISKVEYVNGHSTDVFSSSSIYSITLPNNINYIPQSAFSGCENLREIKNVDPNVDVNHISDKINIIGGAAFSQCKSISNLYIPASVTTMGEAVFNDWGDSNVKQTIFSGLYKAPFDEKGENIDGYNWCANWLSDDIRANVEVRYKTIRVILDKDGGKEDIGTDAVDANLDMPMPVATKPEREYYTFEGYFTEHDGNGTQYYDRDMNSVKDWDKEKDSTLYAHWVGVPYIVTLNPDGNIEGVNWVTARYGSDMPPATAPTRTGYDFMGYYYISGTERTQYYYSDMTSARAWDRPYNAQLTPEWKNRTYNVILKHGEEEEILRNVTYDEDMPPASMPTEPGKIFNGYYTEENGQGTKYYNADMTSANKWNIDEQDVVLYADFIWPPYNVTLDKQGGIGGTSNVTAMIGVEMPGGKVAPTKAEYTFMGYYTEPDGKGTQYYNSNMESVNRWSIYGDAVLYAKWEVVRYTVTLLYTLDYVDKITREVKVAKGEKMPLPTFDDAPFSEGFEFVGFFSGRKGDGTQYYGMEIYTQRAYNPSTYSYYTKYYEGLKSIATWDHSYGMELYPYYVPLECDYTYKNIVNGGEISLETSTVHLKNNTSTTITAKTFKECNFLHFWKNYNEYTSSSVTWRFKLERNELDGKVYPQYGFHAVYEKKTCIAEGSLITLADGRQVPVERLKGDEMLLVWNLYTGKFDSAPILFIDHDPANLYRVINVTFSDGTTVKVLSEHGFWDFDLNQYVYLDANATQYIGHWFNKQTTDEYGNLAYTRVRLVNVQVKEEYTTAWSPETYLHLCYYVNGMLTMPGGSTGLFNIFEVDAETMKYDQEAFERDIATYGLFTYEEFNELLPVPEYVFNAYGAQYFKIAIGKGILTMERLEDLAERYLVFFEQD